MSENDVYVLIIIYTTSSYDYLYACLMKITNLIVLKILYLVSVMT